jgi:hypothetical protein
MVNEIFPRALPEDSKHWPIVSRHVLCSEIFQNLSDETSGLHDTGYVK